MSWFAGRETPLNERHPITVENLPFGGLLYITHSSIVKPSYDIRWIPPGKDIKDKDVQMFTIADWNIEDLINALKKLSQENKDVGYLDTWHNELP